MSWPDIPWSEPGNWYSQEGTALTSQAQGASGIGSVTITGAATTQQRSQGVIGVSGNGLHIIGSMVSGQSSQTVVVQGAPAISGSVSTAQSGQSISAAGSLLISGSGTSGQGQSVSVFAFEIPTPINIALQRMLEYPHSAVFDKAPDERLALILGASQSLTWAVSGGVLTVVANGIQRRFALKSVTFGQLVSLLQSFGITVSHVSDEYIGLGAHMLMDGSGDQAASNGNRLYAYSSELWALFSAYSVEVDKSAEAVLEALKQMIIKTARDEWLDLWGKLYDTPRPDGMRDDPYAALIPREAFRVRVNALAIEQAILDLTGKVVRIEEPWENMFRLSESKLSGDDRLYDGETTGYHLLRPVSTYPIVWDDVLAVIHRNKAAGVIVLDSEARVGISVSGGIAGRVSVARQDTMAALVPQVVDGRLDFMVLSDGSFQRNYAVSVSSLNTYYVEGISPVSISMQYYDISGITWRDAEGWGPFTWRSDNIDSTDFQINGEGYNSLLYYDFDTVEV